MRFPMHYHRLQFILLALITFVIIYYFTSYSMRYDPMAPFSLFNPKLRQSEKLDLVNYMHENNSNDLIYVLAWTKVFGRDWWNSSMENCDTVPQANCLITTDRSYLNRSAALLFHPRDILHADLPSVKYKNQKYVFVSAESPILTYAALQGASSTFFDWTMTYRTDSTIHCPYAYFEPLNYTSNFEHYAFPPDHKYRPDRPLASRPRLVAWIVSHCDTHSKRERYVHELRKYIQVDIYGQCGEKCETSEYNCTDRIKKDYKFYISFENAVCKDYVSEKFAYRIESNLVPIVLRREDYDRFVPQDQQSDPESGNEYNASKYYFIAADDFNGPKDLASYLMFLHENPREYSKYFEWRQKYRIVVNGGRYCNCDLCSKLYLERQKWRDLQAAGGDRLGESVDEEENHQFDIHQWWNVDTCEKNMALKLLDPQRKVLSRIHI